MNNTNIIIGALSHIVVVRSSVFIDSDAVMSHSIPMVQHFDTLTPAKSTKCWSIKDLLYRLIFYDHLNRWSGFEECVEGLQKWLKEAEASLPTEPELKATLDEKRAQLQVYRCNSKPLPTYNTVVCSSNQHRAVTCSKEDVLPWQPFINQ